MDKDQPLVVNTKASSKAHEEGKKKDKKSLAVALCTVIFSIPALIGACCWPALVLPLVGVAITTGARHTAHLISLIIDLVIIGGLCIYVQYKARSRDPYPYSFWKKYGPAILCWISLPFILADPLRHVLGDNDWWMGCERSCSDPKWPSRCNWSSNEYQCALYCGETFDPPFNTDDCGCNRNTDPDSCPRVECTCVHDSQETARHLSPIGITFTIAFTYFGFALFMYANLWNGNILGKCKEIRHKYRVLRGYSEDSDE